MKTLLVYPPATLSRFDPTSPGAFPPLGLAYVAAFVRQNGYEVEILDALADRNRNIRTDSITIGLSDQEIRRRIKAASPDIVGISCHFSAYAQDAHRVAAIVKSIDRGIFTIFGGAHASVASTDVLKDNNVDLVVYGEGELTALDLIGTIEKSKDHTSLLGTVVRVGESIVQNPPRPAIKNLDLLPFPARDLLPMEKYFAWKQNSSEEFDMRHPNTPVATSRGCPFPCVFCSVHSVWGHTWRGRSAINVVDEIELLIRDYKIKEIQFIDDNLTINRKRTFEICDEIIKRKLDIKWCTPNGVAIKTLDETLLRMMKRAGCYRLSFGIETGSLETQEFIRKKIDLEKAQFLIKKASDIGIWTVGFFIIGFPFETEESIMATIKYASTSGLDFATFYLPMPFPGTDLREIMENENLINPSSLDSFAFSGTAGYTTKFFNAEQLADLQKLAYKTSIARKPLQLLQPTRLAKKIQTFQDLRYFMKILFRGVQIKMKDVRYSNKRGYRPISLRVEENES